MVHTWVNLQNKRGVEKCEEQVEDQTDEKEFSNLKTKHFFLIHSYATYY